ncbi:MAG: Eco29kI family restriction endonuclease [Candidatus Porifericomitaceae bacterium WSBS_2022_MAG_OTU9]
MQKHPFDRSKHVYHSEELVGLVKDAIRFFNGTPVHQLPLEERFFGTGVYALYYTGKNQIYRHYAEFNRLEYKSPIYVGKAAPKGWRQSRISDSSTKYSSELHSRILEHSRNIDKVQGINLHEFSCRFVLFEAEGSDMVGAIEAALIRLNKPLWNSVLDGFGNHTPGSGRFHPGRQWAEKCTGIPSKHAAILARIATHVLEL